MSRGDPVEIAITVTIPRTGTPEGSQLVVRLGTETRTLDLEVDPAPYDLVTQDISVVISPTAGATARYSMRVTNVGETLSPETGVTVRGPTGTTVAAVAIGGESCTATACVIPALAPGMGTTVTVDLAIPITGSTDGVLEITVEGEEPERIRIECREPAQADSSRSKQFDGLEQPTAAASGHYYLRVGNAGGEPSLPEKLVVELPVGAFIQGITIEGVEGTCGGAVCTLPSIAPELPNGPDTSLDIDIRVGVPITPINGAIEVQIATESRSIAINWAGTPADLSLSEIRNPEPPTPGNSGIYELTITNSGGIPSSALDLTVALTGDNLRGATITSITAGDQTCDPTARTCSLEPIDGNSRVDVRVTVSVGSAGTDGTLTMAIPGEEPQTFDVSVTGTPTSMSYTLAVTDPPVAGGTGSLSIKYVNAGGTPSESRPIRLGAVPNGMSEVTISVNGVPCGQVCELPSLGFEQTATISVAFSVAITGIDAEGSAGRPGRPGPDRNQPRGAGHRSGHRAGRRRANRPTDRRRHRASTC